MACKTRFCASKTARPGWAVVAAKQGENRVSPSNLYPPLWPINTVWETGRWLYTFTQRGSIRRSPDVRPVLLASLRRNIKFEASGVDRSWRNFGIARAKEANTTGPAGLSLLSSLKYQRRGRQGFDRGLRIRAGPTIPPSSRANRWTICGSYPVFCQRKGSASAPLLGHWVAAPPSDVTRARISWFRITPTAAVTLSYPLKDEARGLVYRSASGVAGQPSTSLETSEGEPLSSPCDYRPPSPDPRPVIYCSRTCRQVDGKGAFFRHLISPPPDVGESGEAYELTPHYGSIRERPGHGVLES